MADEDPKICFVIAPIGEENSETRKRSDQIFTHIIKPIAADCGYKAIRADHLPETGLITSQVTQHIIEASLVIADLTGSNPNVFYELAIRHMLRKPYVQIIAKGERIPFDVAGIRTIEIDHRDLDSVAKAKESIMDCIRSMEGKEDIDSPISVAINNTILQQKGTPEQRQLVQLMVGMEDLKMEIGNISRWLYNLVTPQPARSSTIAEQLGLRSPTRIATGITTGTPGWFVPSPDTRSINIAGYGQGLMPTSGARVVYTPQADEVVEVQLQASESASEPKTSLPSGPAIPQQDPEKGGD
jgi:hypothetical protein